MGIDDETMRFWATFSDKTGETGTKLGLDTAGCPGNHPVRNGTLNPVIIRNRRD
jgi:hypothetical protein